MDCEVTDFLVWTRSNQSSAELSHRSHTKSPLGNGRPLISLVAMSFRSGIRFANLPDPKRTLLPQWLQISMPSFSHLLHEKSNQPKTAVTYDLKLDTFYEIYVLKLDSG